MSVQRLDTCILTIRTKNSRNRKLQAQEMKPNYPRGMKGDKERES